MHLPTTEYNRKTASCPICCNQLCMVKKPFKLLLQQTNGVCCMVGYLLNLCSALVDRFYEDFCFLRALITNWSYIRTRDGVNIIWGKRLRLSFRGHDFLGNESARKRMCRASTDPKFRRCSCNSIQNCFGSRSSPPPIKACTTSRAITEKQCERENGFFTSCVHGIRARAHQSTSDAIVQLEVFHEIRNV